MAQIKDESAVELLVQAGVEENKAWEQVAIKIQQEKDEKGEPAPRKQKEYVALAIDSPDAPIPPNTTVYVIEKTETCLDEHGSEMPGDMTRTWGDLELGMLLRNAPHFLSVTKRYNGSRDIVDILEGGKKNELKLLGINLKTKEPIYLAGSSSL